jgi:hypothetical protein
LNQRTDQGELGIDANDPMFFSDPDGKIFDFAAVSPPPVLPTCSIVSW